jgi:hypothetical protein
MKDSLKKITVTLVITAKKSQNPWRIDKHTNTSYISENKLYFQSMAAKNSCKSKNITKIHTL